MHLQFKNRVIYASKKTIIFHKKCIKIPRGQVVLGTRGKLEVYSVGSITSGKSNSVRSPPPAPLDGDFRSIGSGWIQPSVESKRSFSWSFFLLLDFLLCGTFGKEGCCGLRNGIIKSVVHVDISLSGSSVSGVLSWAGVPSKVGWKTEIAKVEV